VRERTVLQWGNEMVTRLARTVIGDRCVIITVIFNNCRCVAVGDDVLGIVLRGGGDGWTTCGFQMMTGSSKSTKGVGS
jgi:hypothetical protein